MEEKKIMVIDGNSLLHRAFYAIPMLTNKYGVQTNAVYGFTTTLLKLIDDFKPGQIAVAFDRKAPTFRHLIYSDYKAKRDKTPEELLSQFALLKNLLSLFKIDIYEIDGYEADDILGTIANYAEGNNRKVLLVTGDRDALQLISDNTTVVLSRTRRGKSETIVYDEDKLKTEYGLTPAQVVDLKGLMGDASDNIPGVPGVGEKTAIKLLHEFESLENVLDNIDKVSGKKLKENLTNYKEQAVFSKKLATIDVDAPIDFEMDKDCDYTIPKTPELKTYLLELGFGSIISRLGLDDVKANEDADEDQGAKTVAIEKNYVDIFTSSELVKTVDDLKQEDEITFLLSKDLTITGKGNTIYRVYFSENLLDKGLDYVEALNTLKPIFTNDKVKKITHDAKHAMLELRRWDIKLCGLAFDTLIAAYLLEPTQSKYELNKLLFKYLNMDTTNPDVIDLRMLAEEMEVLLVKNLMYDLYKTIEHPLISVLADMELEGFKVDRDILNELDETISKEVNRLTNEIYDLTGEEFNLNSPKQLGVILFEKLGLKVIKKTKTGYSTNIEVLEALRDDHPSIEKIIDYRQVMKLKSTYIDGLKQVIGSDGRIHSSFNQSVTATGRISSTEPNLQNIPVRTELGRNIRKAFIPSSSDHVLVDADYSQIELRVLAHISQDPTLIEAFIKEQDIHRRTASEIFGVPLEEVTDEQRNSAKAVNFGIIYGISDFGLAKGLGITRSKAKEYIENYLERLPLVKEYMERIVKEAKRNGYVTTLFGRRRDLPELSSRNFNIRSFGERVALNTPIQGTAADIIKKAMIDVYSELNRRSLKSKLVLQVHDELIIDTHRDELDEVKELVQKLMVNAAELAVPLVVDIGVGNSWYNAK